MERVDGDRGQLKKWQAAFNAARRALAILPGAQANLDLIALAEQKFREESGP